MKVGRQRAASRIAPPVGELGLQNTGRAGAYENANPVVAVFTGGGFDGGAEIILFQRQLRQPVVAAIELDKRFRQLHRIHPRDFADKGFQRYRFKRARFEPRAPQSQCFQRLLETAA